MTHKRFLTPEEKLLWKYITRHDQPLHIDADIEEVEEIKIIQPKQIGESKNIKLPIVDKSYYFSCKEKKLGDYSGIDKNTAKRFRKGNAPIDAILDLHGMTCENAHHALVTFIEQQVRNGSRCLLVITGKGSGTLRSSLPNWLTASNLSGFILAFDIAKAKHGGIGAYYILLKRKRN